jgi:hypothetical protein
MGTRGTGGRAARRGHEILAGAFIVAILAPNLWALIHPYEDWPYSSLPMYAHYVGEDTPRFKFVFVAELEDGREKEVSPYSIGLDYAAMRFFFKYVYGSVEPGLPRTTSIPATHGPRSSIGSAASSRPTRASGRCAIRDVRFAPCTCASRGCAGRTTAPRTSARSADTT